MKCPYCEKELIGAECRECGKLSPDGAHFCMECGARLSAAGDEAVSDTEDLELDDRVLCPDGNCTGIIIDGKCTECGKAPQDT
jgi:uncharacterized OB-fold protein